MVGVRLMSERSDKYSLKIGPIALISMSEAQRKKAVKLWERGHGIRIWCLDRDHIFYVLGNGEEGEL